MVLDHVAPVGRETPYQALARVASGAAPRRLELVLAVAVVALTLTAHAAAAWP